MYKLFDGVAPYLSIENPECPANATCPVTAPFTPEVTLRKESSKMRPEPCFVIIAPAHLYEIE